MSTTTMTSESVRTLLDGREVALKAAETVYATSPDDAAWSCVQDARSLRDRAQLDLQLSLAREAAERAAEAAAARATAVASFEAAKAEASLTLYLADARATVARFADAMKLAEAHLLAHHARTEEQVTAARLAGRLGADLGLYAPDAVTNEERDLYAIVALEAAGTARRIAELLTPPGMKRLRATLDYGERGTQLSYAIQREAGERGINGHDLGLADMHVSAIDPCDWKDPTRESRARARVAMGINAEGGAS